jgi:hypothetical protein
MSARLSRHAIAILAVLSIVRPGLVQADSPILGRWDFTVDDKGVDRPSGLRVIERDGKLIGEFIGYWGGVHPAKNLTVEDGKLEFDSAFGHHRGQLQPDGTLAGEIDDKRGYTAKWVAEKYVYRPDVRGTWELVLDGEKAELKLDDDGTRVTGSVKLTPDAAPTPIANAVLRERLLTFDVAPGQRFVTQPRGDRIIGAIVAADGEGSEKVFVGYRYRDWGAPIKLFNGKDLSGWTELFGGAIDTWKAEEGVLVNTKDHGQNIRTVDEFEDFRLHIEFNVPKGGNSGVYLRGRYEVQVAEDYGQPPSPGGCGSLYSRYIPPFNASRPPNEWQVYDITLIGEYLTVVHNDRLIIDNIFLEGITGGALDSREGKPGPIYLQGDHTTVKYRNIVLTPARPPK